MSSGYSVRRTIAAPPEQIWALLADGPRYPEWNPSVLSLEGTLTPGQRIRVVSTVNPKRAFTLTVVEMDGPRRMVWSGGMPLGLFQGVRTHTLTPVDGGTEFAMEEVFSGPLAGLITKTIPDMTESFGQFADGLKTAAERATATD